MRHECDSFEMSSNVLDEDLALFQAVCFPIIVRRRLEYRRPSGKKTSVVITSWSRWRTKRRQSLEAFQVSVKLRGSAFPPQMMMPTRSPFAGM